MNPPVDLIIPAAPKDYNKVRFVIRQARQHINLDTVHVIAPEPGELALPVDVIIHRDEDVLPYDREELRYRPNWVFQQLLKVLQDVTDNNWFLVMDADIFAVRRIPLWTDDGKPILYLGRDQNHGPYFTFNEQMFGFGKVYPWSFLSECTLYSKELVRDMVRFSAGDLDGFWDKVVEITGLGCSPADSELYGSYVRHEHQDVYEIRKLESKLRGRYACRAWSDDEIEDELQKAEPGADLISLHSWEGGT